MSYSVGILGARGYVGRELIEGILVHPGLSLDWVSSRQLAGQPIQAHLPDFWPKLRRLGIGKTCFCHVGARVKTPNILANPARRALLSSLRSSSWWRGWWCHCHVLARLSPFYHGLLGWPATWEWLA